MVLGAEELGINARNIRNWRDAAKRDSENAFPGPGTVRDLGGFSASSSTPMVCR
jgi:transposase-like protein